MSLYNTAPGQPLDTGRGNSRAYPDPFTTYSTLLMPRSIKDVLRWSEQLYSRNGTYAMALRRVVRYFLTKIEIQNAGNDQTKERYINFLTKKLDIMTQLAYIGDDFMCYGNAFVSIFVPFRRYLRCEHCGLERPIAKCKYEFQNFKFLFTCPICRGSNVCDRPRDKRTAEEKDIQIIRWSPHYIDIREHAVSRKLQYYFDPPADIISIITKGDPFWMESMPWEIVEAIKARKLFQFAPDMIYHMREEGLAGIRCAGWGITRMMTNFCQAFNVQMLKMYNEVLCTEYIVPFRVISPSRGNNKEADPMVHSNVGSFNARVLRMLQEHRRRPGGYYAIPYPIEYQVLGGEGEKLITTDLINQGLDEMLNAAGVPAELYKGTISMQALPSALRLFQQTWTHLVAHNNQFLNWVVDKVSKALNWEPVECQLQSVTLADDMENKQILLQLAAGNKVSLSAALSGMGIDQAEDLKTIFEEQARFQEYQDAYQKKMQRRQQLEQNMQSSTMQAVGAQPQGGPQPSADPGASGQQPNANLTPQAMMAQAEQMAQQLWAMPQTQRTSEMLKIKKSNPVLHALVKSKLDSMRNSAASQGVQQSQSQAGQQSQGQAPGQA